MNREEPDGDLGTELPDDPRLLQAVQEYLDLLEEGRQPQKQAFLALYPDLAEPLNRCLEGLELVHQAASRDKSATPVATRRHEAVTTEPLGDFQIVREIGRGGMGIVYEAVQLSLGRRVALKVLPFAATFDHRHLERFRHEAQAAAQLHHPNIVPIYAVGCERGVHFYAMQLVEGQSLALVIRQMRQQAGHVTDEDAPPGSDVAAATTSTFGNRAVAVSGGTIGDTVHALSRTLSSERAEGRERFFRRAATLLVQAAEALEHAHQLGIVHRDIKPANLLVEDDGRLWVADFGLAQFHTGTALTQTGDLMGTLRYMSPEQAAGERAVLDHRSDVYSLGATLYELLTLAPIFPGRTRPDLLRQILHEEPLPPRSLTRAIPVELETIVLKAISKSPGDRYVSAQHFADDLRRYLEDRPILARRPRLVDRVRKWSRRHPSLVGAAVVVLLVSVAALLINGWMVGVEQARTAAALQGERQRAAEARRAVDLLVDLSEEELAEHPPMQSVRRRLLETALGYYQDFLASHGGDAAAQAELEGGKARVRRLLDELATLEGMHLFTLTNAASVQADLQLSDPQRESLKALNDSITEQRMKRFRDQAGVSWEERRQRFYEDARGQEAALANLLRPEQHRRLKQIALQVQGGRAFQESHVVEVLKLTTEQRRKIREIKDETFSGMRPGPFPKGGAPAGFGRTEPWDRLMKIEVERILSILTPEQVERWREMIGEPFEGIVRMPPPPGGYRPAGPAGGFSPR